MQGEYCLRYGAVGTRVALIVSEPITGQAGDWVAVPRNTALVVMREKVIPLIPVQPVFKRGLACVCTCHKLPREMPIWCLTLT